MRRFFTSRLKDPASEVQPSLDSTQDEQVPVTSRILDRVGTQDAEAGAWRSRLSSLYAVAAQKLRSLRVSKKPRATDSQPTLPPMAITPKRKEALVVTMAGATVRDYVESGQFARLSAALERYSRHFDEVLLVTADRTDYTEQLGSKVRHLRSKLPLATGKTLRTALAAISNAKSLRHAVAVLALDEPGALAGRVAAKLSRSRLTLSSGAPWSPPRSRSIWTGWRDWPVRLGLSKVDQVTAWRGMSTSALPQSTPTHVLPTFIDAYLFCPLETTDPSTPDSIVALIGPDDTAAAMMLIGAAQRLMRHKHGVVIRAFVASSGAAGEVFAKSLQAQAAERQSAVEFAPLPTFEVLPDVLARPRVCIGFGSEQTLPLLLSSMACGVPCVVVDRNSESTGGPADRPDWRDFVLKAGDSDTALARGIEAVLREPIVRSRLAREGRRYVVSHHSLEAIQRKEAEIFRKPGPVAEEREALAGKRDGEFDAETEAAKLAAVLTMTAAIDEETAA